MALVRQKTLIALGLVLTLGVLLMAAPRSAHAYSWGGSLSAHQWKSSGYVEPSQTYLYGKVESGGGSSKEICVGPVRNGSEFPYGWACAAGVVGWEFAAISAAEAVYDDTAGSMTFGAYSA